MRAKKGETSLHPAGLSLDDNIDLSKLDRLQLLQLLDDAVRENERLAKELAETKQRLESELADVRRQLEDKHIAIEESGTLSEAALRLAGMFADAQHAIDLYAYNVAESGAHNSARLHSRENVSYEGVSISAAGASPDAAPSTSNQNSTGSNTDGD